MSNPFAEQAARLRNQVRSSLAVLVGIAQGLIADRQLVDEEIRFLSDWLAAHEVIATAWPGDVIHQRIRAVLADGVVSDAERTHLLDTLRQLVGSALDDLAESPHVTQLDFDDVPRIDCSGATFCLTGDFVFGPRANCVAVIEDRGGIVKNSVTKKTRYVVAGGLGSPEWKHGSFGTKLELAMRYRREGVPLLVVHEQVWAASL